MCGVAGFVGAGDRADLESMAAALVHRGPDDAGFHIEPEYAGVEREGPIEVGDFQMDVSDRHSRINGHAPS